MDVSFLITTFNSSKFLNKSINSCLNQRDHNLNFEIIIINDGSTDDTDKILSKFNSKNIKIFKTENSGIEKSINLSFKKSSGDYLIRVDADDYLEENFLLSVEKYLNISNFFYTNYTLVSEDEKLIRRVQLPKFDINEILERGDFMATGTIYHRSLIEKYGGYNTKCKNCGLENYEFILKLISKNIKGCLIPLNLVNYRRHDNNMSDEKRQSIINYGKKIAKNFNLEAYKTNKYHPYGLKI